MPWCTEKSLPPTENRTSAVHFVACPYTDWATPCVFCYNIYSSSDLRHNRFRRTWLSPSLAEWPTATQLADTWFRRSNPTYMDGKLEGGIPHICWTDKWVRVQFHSIQARHEFCCSHGMSAHCIRVPCKIRILNLSSVSENTSFLLCFILWCCQYLDCMAWWLVSNKFEKAQNYFFFFGLCPSSCILNTTTHNVSESGSVSETLFSSFYDTGRLAKSKNPVILSITHHRQNPSEPSSKGYVNKISRHNQGTIPAFASGIEKTMKTLSVTVIPALVRTEHPLSNYTRRALPLHAPVRFLV
jgi:hypothetical protein